jgi:hypothetical protein
MVCGKPAVEEVRSAPPIIPAIPIGSNRPPPGQGRVTQTSIPATPRPRKAVKPAVAVIALAGIAIFLFIEIRKGLQSPASTSATTTSNSTAPTIASTLLLESWTMALGKGSLTFRSDKTIDNFMPGNAPLLPEHDTIPWRPVDATSFDILWDLKNDKATEHCTLIKLVGDTLSMSCTHINDSTGRSETDGMDLMRVASAKPVVATADTSGSVVSAPSVGPPHLTGLWMVNAAESPPASAAEMMMRLNADHSFELDGLPSGQWRAVDSQTFAFHFIAAPESHDFEGQVVSQNADTMVVTLKYSTGTTGHQRWTRAGPETPAVASQNSFGNATSSLTVATGTPTPSGGSPTTGGAVQSQQATFITPTHLKPMNKQNKKALEGLRNRQNQQNSPGTGSPAE